MIGGLKIEGKKDSSLVSWQMKRPRPPERVRIFLSQGAYTVADPCVVPGDHVVAGQVIAKPMEAGDVTVHASISGQVNAVEKVTHPLGGEVYAVEILSDGLDETLSGMGTERAGWQDLERHELAGIFQSSGLHDMNVFMRPLHPIPAGALHTLVLNGCESEPYLTSAYSVIMSDPLAILKGARILGKYAGARQVIFALESHHQDVAEVLMSKINLHGLEEMEVRLLASRYPRESGAALAYEFLGKRAARTLLRGAGNSFRDFDAFDELYSAGIWHLDIHTAFAVYEAVALQKPLIERGMTVAGECVIEPRNVWVRIGTSFEDVLKSCRGLMRDPKRVLMNGPMRGFAQENLDVPVVVGTQAVLGLPPEVARPAVVNPCIRCGACNEACPVEIAPSQIALAAEKNLFEIAEEWGARQCIECGICSYVCPSERPMTELIRYAALGLEEGDDQTLRLRQGLEVDARFMRRVFKKGKKKTRNREISRGSVSDGGL